MSKLLFTLLHSVCKKCCDTCELMKKKCAGIREVIPRQRRKKWIIILTYSQDLKRFAAWIHSCQIDRVVPSWTHCCLWPHFISITQILSVGCDGLWTLSYASYFCHPSFRSLSFLSIFYAFFFVPQDKNI